MTQRSKIWRYGAAVWTLINAGGAIYAAAMGEPMHAAVHVVLMIVGIAAYAMWRPSPELQQEDMAAVSEANERVQHLEQSLNSIALNVERIGEAQRYERKILEERGEVSPTKKED